MDKNSILVQPKSILVATPAFACQAYTGYIISVLQLQKACILNNIPIEFIFRHDPIISRARNTLAHIFLKSSYSHMLFLDADIQVSPDLILNMLNENKMLVASSYPKKEINWNGMMNYIQNNKTHTLEELKTYSKNNTHINNINNDVMYAGTGIMLISREALNLVINTYPDEYYFDNNEKVHRFFDGGVINNTYLSEDYWFCYKYRSAGGKITLVEDHKTSHWGVHCFN